LKNHVPIIVLAARSKEANALAGIVREQRLPSCHALYVYAVLYHPPALRPPICAENSRAFRSPLQAQIT
jgi:hypothetical protein